MLPKSEATRRNPHTDVNGCIPCRTWETVVSERSRALAAAESQLARIDDLLDAHGCECLADDDDPCLVCRIGEVLRG
jgi:hypothetical protein